MNKSDLIDAIASQQNVSKAKAKEIVEGVLETIKNGVVSNGKVSLHGFGTFTHATRKARAGVNPATGAKIQIAEKQVVKFKSQF